MNITFLIGNGFDLSLGLKTSYSSFIKYYLDISNDDIKIFNFKEKIQTNLKNWSDAEVAFGEYASLYKADELDDFMVCYNDFCSELKNYLEEQIQSLDFKSCEQKTKQIMSNSLRTFYQNLRPASKNKIEKLMDSYKNNRRQFFFINFNYTNTFDSCIELLGERGQVFISDKIGPTSVPLSVNGIVHIHGTTKREMILGIDNEQQTKGELLNIRRFNRQFIKPNANIALENENDTIALRFINQSNIICIFGMSLGKTDMTWWINIGNWLKANNQRHLLIYVVDDNFRPYIVDDYFKIEEEIENRFFDYSNFNDKEKDALRKQIHILVNENLFPLDIPKLNSRIVNISPEKLEDLLLG